MSKYALAIQHVVTRLKANPELMTAVKNKVFQGAVTGAAAGPSLVVQSYGTAAHTMLNRSNAHTTVDLLIRVEQRTEQLDPLVPLIDLISSAVDFTSGVYPNGRVNSCYITEELDPTDEAVNGQNYKSLGVHVKLTVN